MLKNIFKDKFMANSSQSKSIAVPQKLLSSIIEAQRKWDKVSNELEDFLLSSDKNFLKKIRQARNQHQHRKLKDLEILKKELD